MLPNSAVQNKEGKAWSFLKIRINDKLRKSQEKHISGEAILSFCKVRSQGAKDKTIPTEHETVKKSN